MKQTNWLRLDAMRENYWQLCRVLYLEVAEIIWEMNLSSVPVKTLYFVAIILEEENWILKTN